MHSAASVCQHTHVGKPGVSEGALRFRSEIFSCVLEFLAVGAARLAAYESLFKTKRLRGRDELRQIISVPRRGSFSGKCKHKHGQLFTYTN